MDGSRDAAKALEEAVRMLPVGLPPVTDHYAEELLETILARNRTRAGGRRLGAAMRCVERVERAPRP